LFSMLASRVGSFEGLQVADLFAGSGALGLESLSRGAAHCVFVENDRRAVEAIRSNIASLGASAEVLARNAEHAALPRPVDLAFLDPPYGSGLAPALLAKLAIAPGGWVSVETGRSEPVAPEGYAIEAERCYGKARITLLRRVEVAAEAPRVSEPTDLDPPALAARRLAAALEHEQAHRPVEALREAWAALDLDPGGTGPKARVERILRHYPGSASADRRDDLERLLTDPAVEPSVIARAAWRLLLTEGQPLAAHAPDPPALAGWAETDTLATRLLEESPVTVMEAERALTGLRRWLLLSRRWPEFPRLTAALRAQAALNDGAWLIEPDERARLDSEPEALVAAAYFPSASGPRAAAAFRDPVTAAVAGQYEEWPYPPWSRITASKPKTVPDAIQELDEGRPSGLPVEADLLVAGCGTGREAALCALRFPQARITAIDLSAASLAYARSRCAAIGIDRIDFRQLDLHDVAALGTSFDFISCSGVLHHLPDPEAGWAALAAVLRPRGAMRVMVYSKVARLKVRAAQRHLADLRDRPVDSDLLREARRRLIERAPDLLASSPDFYSLAGVYDLLLHRHEDSFDVPRIVRALDRLGLELLAFHLPTPGHRARYRREHPEDPAFRDVEAWASLERREPFLFQGMYSFHCRKPAL
jgi:16S rRNA (guanine(966)-N(2))-methyltransferase RsmD